MWFCCAERCRCLYVRWILVWNQVDGASIGLLTRASLNFGVRQDPNASTLPLSDNRIQSIVLTAQISWYDTRLAASGTEHRQPL